MINRSAGAINEAVQSMGVLHFAEFGGLLIKVLFFLLTMAGSAVILTGNLTWLEARRRQDRAINNVLARLTAGAASGLLPATALLFLSGRILAGVAAHPRWRLNGILFGSWLVSIIYALSRRNVARSHHTLLIAGGLLALLIPLVNGLTTGDWPWIAWGQQWAVLGVDMGAILCGLAALEISAYIEVEAASR